MAGFIGFVLVLVVVVWMPVLGLLAGLLGCANALGYLLKPKLRPALERVFMPAFASQRQRTALAVLGLLGGCLLILLSGVVLDAQRSAAQAAAQAAELEQAKAEDNRLASEALAASSRQKLRAGDLDGAKADLVAAKQYGGSGELAALGQAVAASEHEQALEQLPGLLSAIQAQVASEAWDGALAECVRARAIDGSFAGLEPACAEASEGQRLAQIPGWIDEALALAKDKQRCTTAQEIADAWANLRRVRPEDPTYKRAVAATAKLEKCRKKTEQEFTRAVRQLMVIQRENWAEVYELGLLDKGMDVRVSLSGTHKDRVKIRWVLLSRANVHQITKDGTFLADLEKIGFQKVSFSDGFYESWSYDLAPESEANGGKMALRELGLDQALKL